ncbi:MAG: sensor domain-containing diguanylate cyclase [Deltaproteobacteria bacterium]|nr:sensor domain-containing diguanylate cyclase [Deltaproteobacteria bacterium]
MRTPDTNARYQRIFSVLFEITKLINSGMDLEQLLRRIAAEVMGLIGANSCSIMLLDEERHELLCKAAGGLTAEQERSLSFRLGDGVAGWVAANGTSALIDDVRTDARFTVLPGQSVEILSLLCVPLKHKDETIGTITITSDDAGAFGAEHEETLAFLGNSIVLDIQNARLYRLSVTDSLTKAYNRQYLYQKLPEEIERCRRYGNRLSLILFDIDNFKKFNDAHGHAAGDCVLRGVVAAAGPVIRDIDSLVRFGGEEFLVLLPQTPLASARSIAERLRQLVEQSGFVYEKTPLSVTVSAGVAEYQGAADSEGFIKQADEALYRAKMHGRNRVETYSPASPEPLDAT